MKTIIFELLLIGTILFAVAVGLSIKGYLKQQKIPGIINGLIIYNWALSAEEVKSLCKFTAEGGSAGRKVEDCDFGNNDFTVMGRDPKLIPGKWQD